MRRRRCWATATIRWLATAATLAIFACAADSDEASDPAATAAPVATSVEIPALATTTLPLSDTATSTIAEMPATAVATTTVVAAAATFDGLAAIHPDTVTVISDVAAGAGFGDPFDVDMPIADFAETRAWLTSEGAPAVALVTETTQLWTHKEPDCLSVARSLGMSGSPREILAAALATPDQPTSEVLTTLHTAILAALSACDPGSVESSEYAWQWIVVYRRLLEANVIQ